MHMLLRRLKDRARAAAFLLHWFHLACAHARLAEGIGALEQHVFTAAALVSLLAAVDVDLRALHTSLHEALECFAGGDVDQARAVWALLTDQHVGFTSLLLGGQVAHLKPRLLAILETRTHRRDLQEAMDAYHAGRMPDASSPLFSKDQPCGPQLRAALSRWGTKPTIREQRTEEPVCAHCFVELNTRAAQDLEAYRVAQCTSCRRLTVRLKP